MMATINQTPILPKKSKEMLLITHPALRERLLKARLLDEMSASCLIQRGDHLYLSLRDIADEAQRREVAWAVMRLQMGAIIQPHTLPEPLKTALMPSLSRPSPLLQSLMLGGAAGVIGGVLIMALVGLVMMVFTTQTDSYVGIAATAVSFVLSGTAIGCSVTVYFWRRFCATPPTIAKIPK
jgi:hypothetical protein